MESKKTFKKHLKKDLILFVLSIIAAFVVSASGLLDYIFLLSAESEIIGALVAGLLFTSFFTTPLAIAMFLALAPEMNIFVLVTTGALGALVGDLTMYGFIRHTFEKDVDYLLSRPKYKRIMAILNRRTFRWIIPLVGAIIIASPFPEELGISLLSVAHMKASTLAVVSFTVNSIAIACISVIS